jgi:Acetyltransferase (GNAT) domain
MNISFARVANPDWEELDRMTDRTIFQTIPWLDFIVEAQGAEICLLECRADNHLIAYFTGLIVKKMGMKILGAPFPGWTTQYLGFNLVERADRSALLEPLAKYTFAVLGCRHFELMDRFVTPEQIASIGWKHRLVENMEIDMSGSEDEIFANMKGSCRTSIRKAEKSGVVLEQASDPAFADEFYTQMTDVFAKQGMRPTFGVDRVKLLVRHLLPTGNLLLVRARNAEGVCIATGIYPAFNGTMYFWGGASLREYQILQPNEAVHWYAMQYWKARGVVACDMGGGGAYKLKYGGTTLTIPWCRKSSNQIVGLARDWAQKSHSVVRRLVGRRF